MSRRDGRSVSGRHIRAEDVCDCPPRGVHNSRHHGTSVGYQEPKGSGRMPGNHAGAREIELDEDEVYVPPDVAARIADQIADLGRAAALFAHEWEALRGASVTPVTVRRIQRLVDELFPLACANADLADLRPELQRAGLRVWRDRIARDLA